MPFQSCYCTNSLEEKPLLRKRENSNCSVAAFTPKKESLKKRKKGRELEYFMQTNQAYKAINVYILLKGSYSNSQGGTLISFHNKKLCNTHNATIYYECALLAKRIGGPPKSSVVCKLLLGYSLFQKYAIENFACHIMCAERKDLSEFFHVKRFLYCLFQQ